MTLGLVRNKRDPDMIELCDRWHPDDPWDILWGVIPVDGLDGVLEGELYEKGIPADEPVDCVIAKREEWNRMESGIDKALSLGEEALYTEGGHHKQWYIERIMEALGADLEDMAQVLTRWGRGEWEKGIAP